MDRFDLEPGDLFKDASGDTWLYDGEHYWRVYFGGRVNLDLWPHDFIDLDGLAPFTKLVLEKKETPTNENG